MKDKMIHLGGKEWTKGELERVYINPEILNILEEDHGFVADIEKGLGISNNELVAVQDIDGEISTGLAKSGTKEGDKVTINLCDENGKEIQATGIVIEIL